MSNIITSTINWFKNNNSSSKLKRITKIIGADKILSN